VGRFLRYSVCITFGRFTTRLHALLSKFLNLVISLFSYILFTGLKLMHSVSRSSRHPPTKFLQRLNLHDCVDVLTAATVTLVHLHWLSFLMLCITLSVPFDQCYQPTHPLSFSFEFTSSCMDIIVCWQVIFTLRHFLLCHCRLKTHLFHKSFLNMRLSTTFMA